MSGYSIDDKKVIYADLHETEGVVLNLTTKNYYRLNETGQVVWQGLVAKKTPEEIAEELTEQFDVSFDDALSDVHETIQQLKTEQLLQDKTAAQEKPAASVKAAQKAKRTKK